jgi:hypothetical protein
MPGVRHAVLVILAVFGLLTTIAWAGAAAACPAEPSVSTPMHHHNGCEQGVPTDHSVQLCAVCLAVLPSPAVAQTHAVLPFTPVASRLEPLSGIDPALDPPPPRAA